MKEQFDNFINIIRDMTNDFSTYGIVTEIIDVIISIIIIIIILRSLKMKFRGNRVIVVAIIALLMLALAFFFNLDILMFLIKYVGFWLLGLIIIIYNVEIRRVFDKSFHESNANKNFTSQEEKNRLIDTLVETSIYLSERKVGALITIEGKDSLDSIIDKSIIVNSDVSLEILSTLFYVGTVTHDGAVIIRKNVIKCAGAYLPSTDRYDIPKELGTRHRAAIGISERCDAITIVVSEETGHISVTVHGGIEIDINPAKLRELLEQYIVVK